MDYRFFIYICIFTVIIISLILDYKCIMYETYKRQRRDGIRIGWKRKGSAAKNIALNGTRYNKLPSIEKLYSDEPYII